MTQRRKRALLVDPNQKGHALLMTLVLLAVLSVAVGSMFTSQAAAVRVTGDMISTRQAFYACDGIARSMLKLAQNYLQDTANPEAEAMAEAICTAAGMAGCDAGGPNLPGITPPGYTVDGFKIEIVGQAFTAPLPGGPFQGMNARQTPVSLRVRATKTNTGHACESSQDVVLAQVGLFQFFVFGEEFADIQNPPPMTIDGRIHVNGDFCGLASDEDLKIRRLTASGAIYAHCDDCPLSCGDNSWADDGFMVWDGDDWVRIDKDNDQGCTNAKCPGGWAEYAPSHWNNHLLAGVHGVPVLRVPVDGDPLVQDGFAVHGAIMSNQRTQRFLVDPPLSPQLVADPPIPEEDGEDVRAQKFACKADIRIINGVWYKRTPGDETCSDWPGEPIWSDHPKTVAIAANRELGLVGAQPGVGQENLASLHGWSSAPDQRPRRYSYYRTNAAGMLINPTFNVSNRAVISYGRLLRDTGLGIDRPLDDIATSATTGFKDLRVEQAESPAKAAMLPMNIDIGALAMALQETGAGELGHHFPAGSFNGIIWITNTWENQYRGFGNAGTTGVAAKIPALWPTQPGATGTGLLPYPLCSSTTNPVVPSGAAASLNVPVCTTPNNWSVPNAIRLINGRELDPVAFPKGLTIATNLPAYVLRDFNVNPSGNDDHWRPFLLAADSLTLLSNGFDEEQFKWSGHAGTYSRVAQNTSYRLAVIVGDVPTSPKGVPGEDFGGGINNFPRFLEHWTGVTARIRGSMVMGFRSVFQRQPFVSPPVYYTAPIRDWEYETNFDVLSKHPPGAPVYDVQAIKRWRRN